MNFSVTVDASNNITGLFCDDPEYAAPPSGAQGITSAEADILRKGFAGYQLVAGAVVKTTDFAALKTAACVAIDTAAAAVRSKYCAYDLLDQEYKLAYADAVAWLANQDAPVPETIQVWVRNNAAKNWTALDAANDIKTTGDFMNAKLVAIRSARLDGKGAVNACTNEAAAIAAARDAAIAALGLL